MAWRLVLMQSAEADLNWSRLLAEATEAGCEFQVLTVRGKKGFLRIASYRTGIFFDIGRERSID